MKEILSKVDEAQAKINALRPFSNEMNHQIKEYFRIGLTYSSNALEGNSLTISETKVVIEDGQLRVLREGAVRKFVQAVEHRTFSGSVSFRKGQRVLYITERCVFRLTGEGLELIELAPGIDLERDVLAHMDFRPAIAAELRLMPECIFRPEPMGLLELLTDR